MTAPRSFAEAVELRALAEPDGELVRRVGEPAVTAGALLERALGLASRLAAIVSRGDTVATAVPASPEAVALTTAISWLGAVELPLPEGLDPTVARTLARSARCVTSVVTTEALDRDPWLRALGAHSLHPVLTLTDHCPDAPALDEITPHHTPRHRPDLNAPAAVMVTSGTGGRPKGALLPNGAGLGQAERVLRAMAYGADDVLLNVFPWQHVNARHAAFLPAVRSGARLVMAPFSVSRFWSTAVEEQVTAFNFMGSMCAMLLRQPAAPSDREHRVRQGYGGPAPAWMYERVRTRFNVELRQAYACTELGDVATTGADIRPGAAGQVVPEYELRVVDERGTSLPDGIVGTVQVRPRRPGLTFTEYVGDPGATAAAWQDGWFVTGDRGRLDDDWLHHDGRAADVIRRRGVTIDAERVEQVAMAHADVQEAAAVGVASELTDDEVLLVIVPRRDARLDPVAVHRHCAAHLPRHSVPRFVSVEPALPRTASLKIVHRVLRDRGLPPLVWDAETSAALQENS